MKRITVVANISSRMWNLSWLLMEVSNETV